MGQLITKLMGIFGKQGKGAQSIREPASIWIPIWDSLDLGSSGRKSWRISVDLRGSFSPGVVSPVPSLPSSQGSGFGAPQGAELGEPLSSG